MSYGDPGGWEVDGSEGPAFLGFDGMSYSFMASFENPVAGVQLDVARAAGGTPFLFFDDFTLLGVPQRSARRATTSLPPGHQRMADGCSEE